MESCRRAPSRHVTTDVQQGAEATPAGQAGEEQDEPDDDSRLLLSPTGRPLRKGVGYFSDHYLFFPGISYGVTDNLSLSGAMSMAPGVGAGGQIYFLSPKLGQRFSERFSASVGLLYVHVPWADEGQNVGLGYAVGTFGAPGASFSAGVGVWRRTRERERFGPHYEYLGSERTTEHAPVVMFGGEKRLSPHVALVSENWLWLQGGDAHLPIGLALRLSGRALSADLGVVTTPSTLGKGFPLPWVSVSYHFGRDRR